MFGQAKILQLELSSMCNALCLGCQRTEPYNYNETRKVLPKKQIVKLETFEKILQSETMFTLEDLEFCGTIDDPLMHPQFLEFLSIAHKHDKNITPSIHTNGSLRNPAYFKKLGKQLQKFKHHSLHFSIDGLYSTNHIYRQNTDFKKIIENAKAVIGTGANVIWQYLIFPWNESQVDQAEEIAYKLGFSHFHKRYDLSHISKTETLKSIDRKKILNASPPDIKLPPKSYKDKEDLEIICNSLERKMYFLSYDSRIWPCCFLHNGFFMGHNMVEHLTNRLYKNYGQNFNSLEHYDIDEIVQHDFFKNDLIDSFNEKIGEYKCGKIRRCADTCTVKRVTKI